MAKRILIRFSHGGGDAVQLGIVLKTLSKQRPHWIIDVESLYGKHSLFYGLCKNTYITGQNPNNNYNEIFNLSWGEPGNGDEQREVPMTKVTLCLRNELHITPVQELYYYTINIVPESITRVKEYLNTLPQQKKIVCIHYQANTSAGAKNIDTGLVKKLCDLLNNNGYIVIILDWDRRSGLPNRETIFCPGCDNPLWQKKNTGDGNTIAALIQECDLFIGVDSFPAHIAGATETPSIIVWKDHHPVNFFDLSKNCIHFLPSNSQNKIRCCNKREAETYFLRNYKHTYYNNLGKELRQLVIDRLHLTNINLDPEPDAKPEKALEVKIGNIVKQCFCDGSEERYQQGLTKLAKYLTIS
jgi:ADP-heptose:LPS heptosyltransferase